MDGKRRKRKFGDDSRKCLIYQAYHGRHKRASERNRTSDLLITNQSPRFYILNLLNHLRAFHRAGYRQRIVFSR